MAEINIEPKKKAVSWPWILGILALIVLVIWLLTRDRNVVERTEGSLREYAPQATYVHTAHNSMKESLTWLPLM